MRVMINHEAFNLVHTYILPNGIRNHALIPEHKIQWLEVNMAKENFWLDHCIYMTDHELEINGAVFDHTLH